MNQDFQLRDVFNPAVVTQLAQSIRDAWPDFDQAGFTDTINSQLESLSFGDRNKLIRDSLWAYLPQDFPRAIEILLAAQWPEIPECELTGFDRFVVMSQNDFVAKYGLEHFELSMNALYEMTRRFTAEGAIRAFIQRYPDKTLVRLAIWAGDQNCHVRRLVSEGTRPRLPLAPRLPDFVEDPRPVIALLDTLKSDPELMVRRSVANNLNDIAKDNPALVVETLKSWQKIDDPGTAWIIRHASRTLVKQGNKDVLGLLGYPPGVAIKVSGVELSGSHIPIGDDLTFKISIQSNADAAQNLMVDYIVHHMKANGKLAPKVFKLAKKKLSGRETLQLSKKHSFRPLSTRKYYPGEHLLEIQINGKIYAQAAFSLDESSIPSQG
jgi:3-methyladenine DNA glycosylase AlkC